MRSLATIDDSRQDSPDNPIPPPINKGKPTAARPPQSSRFIKNLANIPVSEKYKRLKSHMTFLQTSPPHAKYASKSSSHYDSRVLLNSILSAMRVHKSCNLFVVDGVVEDVSNFAIMILGSRRIDMKIYSDPEQAFFLLRRIAEDVAGYEGGEEEGRGEREDVNRIQMEKCLHTLLVLCVRSSSPQTAFDAYKYLTETGPYLVSPSVSTINTLATGLVKGGKVEEAKKVMERVEREGIDGYGRTVMMKIKRVENDLEEGKKIMREWDGADKGKFVGLSILVDIIKESPEGTWDEISEVLDEARSLGMAIWGGDETIDWKNGEGNRPNPNDLVMSYAGILSPALLAGSKMKNWDFVKESVDEIVNERFRLASVYAHGIKAVKEGVEDGAFQVGEGADMVGRILERLLELYEEGFMDWRRTKEKEIAFYWLGVFASDIVEREDVDMETKREIARWTLGWLEKIIEGGRRPTMSGYTLVMKTMGRAGAGEKAWEMFLEEAKSDLQEKIANSSKTRSKRNTNDGWVVTNRVGWNAVISACLHDEGGPSWERAKEIFETMSEYEESDDYTWYCLLEVAARSGEVGEAMNYLEKMIRKKRKGGKTTPNLNHFKMVFEAIRTGTANGGDDGMRAEEYTNMVSKVLSQGISTLELDSYFKLMGDALHALSAFGEEEVGVRVVMDVVRNAEQGGRLKCTVPEAILRVLWGCRRLGSGTVKGVEAVIEIGEEMGFERNIEIYRAATASVGNATRENPVKGTEDWTMEMYGDAVEKGFLGEAEVVGSRGLVDLHGCNVALAIGGIHWTIERAMKEGWNEVAIVTGNERDKKDTGIRNNAVKTLQQAGCEGLYTLDKLQNKKNLGRINIMGKGAIEDVAKALRKWREEH